MKTLGGEFAGVPVVGGGVGSTDEVNGTYFVGVVTEVLRQQRPVGNDLISEFTCETNVTEEGLIMDPSPLAIHTSEIAAVLSLPLVVSAMQA